LNLPQRLSIQVVNMFKSQHFSPSTHINFRYFKGHILRAHERVDFQHKESNIFNINGAKLHVDIATLRILEKGARTLIVYTIYMQLFSIYHQHSCSFYEDSLIM
jgi:hypothetical protein